MLRIGGERTELLGIDRRAEEAAARVAADLGVGPEVVAFVEPEGSLVTRFVEGEPVPSRRCAGPRRVREVAGAPAPRARGAAVSRRASTRFASSRPTATPPPRTAFEPPPAYREAKATADQIERRLGARSRSCRATTTC